MRRLPRFPGWLSAVVLIGSVVGAGCLETDPTPTPESPAPEAPEPDAAEPDAGVDVDGGTPAPEPDAPTPEAPEPDAPTPEAPEPDAPTPEAPEPDAPTPEPDVPPACAYPDGPQGFSAGQTLPPYAWTNAFSADGTNAPLRLDEAPCETIEWSPFDTLAFIAIPAW